MSIEAKKLKQQRSVLGRGLSALISAPVPALPGRVVPFQAISQAATPERADGAAAPAISSEPPATEPEFSVARALEGEHQGRASGLLQAMRSTATSNFSGVSYLAIERLIANPKQPRQEFLEAELKELSDSIKTLGVLQPILVRPSMQEEQGTQEGVSLFEIVAGERRFRAAKLAELTQVPVVVRELSDKEALEFALVENVQRANLNPVEEARAYLRLQEEFGMSQSEIADRVGKERASVANYLRLVKLPEEVLALLQKGELTVGHAKAILTIREASAQLSLARKVAKEALSVRALEAIVSKVLVLDAGKRSARTNSGDGQQRQPLDFPDVTDRLRNALGTKVSIKHHASGRGRVEIEYFSEAELDRIIEKILSSSTKDLLAGQ
jgi:ParB family chromosome partitioning protein